MAISNDHPYRKGDHLVNCQVCNFKYYKSECSFRWDGLFVCRKRCWEVRHPLDFIRSVPDDMTVYPVTEHTNLRTLAHEPYDPTTGTFQDPD